MKNLFFFVASAAFLAIAASPTEATLVIKDQGDASNTFTGAWYYQGEAYTSENWVNDDSMFADAEGAVFTWNFSDLADAVYYVYASWKNSGDGAYKAIYSGLDGDDVTINQRLAPSTTKYNGVPFGYLGQVTVSGGAAAISLTSAFEYANDYPYADAIALDSDNPPPAVNYVMKDQEDPANIMSGEWTYQVVAYPATELWVNNDSRWAYGGESVFTWNFSGVNNGRYYAYASWANSGDGSGEAVYSGLDGGNVTVNQFVPPNSTTYNGLPFGYLGEVTVTDGTAAISLSSASNYPYADAIILDPDKAPPPPKEFIVRDQEDPANTMSGDWTYQVVTYPTKEFWVNDDSRWANGGDAVFTWNFSDLDNGMYEVYASWANSGDGAADAVYSGIDGGDVSINQKNKPTSVVVDGVPFGFLGLLTVIDGTVSISLTAASNYPYADAIALSPLIGRPGDANGDGKVDDLDASVVGAHWLQSVSGGVGDGDFNGDGNVNDKDAAILAAHWGEGGGEESVPEPGSLALLAGIAVTGMIYLRRRKA